MDGTVLLGVLNNVGSSLQTGGVISALTEGSTMNGRIGDGNGSAARFGVAATLTTAATQFLSLGMSLMILAKDNAASIKLKENFNGSVILTPGNAVFVCASSATVATYYQRLSWYEYPE